ncbi:hypothetical protein [Mycolicibacterium rhodesiae]|uniref:Mce-associated membrane protein n=1 Tax=Mycolicibacterium rhodesiae TaxID=36814 RepID=A0A1X0IQA3_MYCRH|nr:hypothetical protein [Mycolicibacterium rhodesiae]MCV7347769.1 hypothetical protein [Mycolicibacterium rhodesiae]ORB50573.1 hypothetical protein BST42_19905 [Mycolicibacterium rhodesiae]
MTDSPVGEDDKVDDAVSETTDAPAASGRASRSRSFWVAIVLAVLLVGGGVFGFLKYREVNGQLAQARQAQADREAAAQLARDYAMKSLTYSFEDPDAFFRSVEDGVSQQLKDKYVNATDLLKAVMLQAQVSSTGEVLATDPVLTPDGSYEVVVSAHQTTRNLQNPTPKVSIILLRVTVNKAGNGWQVTDIGPKTGTKAPEEQQLPGAAPAPPAPGAAPAPAKPAPAPPAPRP